MEEGLKQRKYKGTPVKVVRVMGVAKMQRQRQKDVILKDKPVDVLKEEEEIKK